jgi:hypothetical protein
MPPGTETPSLHVKISMYMEHQVQIGPSAEKCFFANPKCNGILNVRRLIIYLIIYDTEYKLIKVFTHMGTKNDY